MTKDNENPENKTPEVPKPPIPTPPENKTPPAGEADLGFPKDTPLSEMTAEQVGAYWRNQSRVQEAERRKAETERDEERQKLADAQLTADEKAVKDAKQAAFAEGEEKGKGFYLRDAIEAKVAIAAGLGLDEIETALEFVDYNRFIVDGKISNDKIVSFASSISGTSDKDHKPGTPWSGANDAGFRQNGKTPPKTANQIRAERREAAKKN